MAEAYSRMIPELGFITATAGFLIWFLTNQLSMKVDRLANSMEKNTRTVAFLAAAICKSSGVDPDEIKKMVGMDD